MILNELDSHYAFSNFLMGKRQNRINEMNKAIDAIYPNF